MNTLTRTFRFVTFTLVEYTRSGRILIELLAALVAFYLFFRRGNSPMPADYFFSTIGLLVVILAFYTTSAIMSLGNRPQNYLILASRLGHIGYLIGLYLSALVIELSIYGLLCLAVAFTNPVAGLSVGEWVLGTVPLILNMALLAALLTLIAPIVLTSGWRLAVLGIVAMAFSGNLIGGGTMENLGSPIQNLLSVLRTLFSTPLLPAFTGYSLSISRDYSGLNIAIPFAQLSLTLGLLGLALYAFTRRELIFNNS